MVSWLKKAGQDVMTWLGFAAKIAPVAAPIVSAIDPAAAPLVTAGLAGVEAVESVVVMTEGAFASAGQGSAGDAKKAAAVTSAAQALGVPAFLAKLAGQQVIDPTLWQTAQTELNNAVEQLTQGVVDALNAVGSSKATASTSTPAAG